ncbi:hypothetical protein BDZ97DRAFT_2064252 [Flammula alnicola]|nr:hypothetical protein BDZ97DRAFT_2064252 [Flammula alnicola]
MKLLFTSTAAFLALAPYIVAQTTVPEWGQCGGISWSGPTVCADGLECICSGSPWYWNCLVPNTATPAPACPTSWYR